MSHFVKTDDKMLPEIFDDVVLPDIIIMSTSNPTRTKGGIQNFMTPIQKIHGGNGESEKIERAVLENMKDQAERLSSLIDYRLQEL